MTDTILFLDNYSLTHKLKESSFLILFKVVLKWVFTVMNVQTNVYKKILNYGQKNLFLLHLQNYKISDIFQILL